MIFMVGLLSTASLSGCLGSGDRTEPQAKEDTNYQNEQELTDWQVHFAASTSIYRIAKAKRSGGSITYKIKRTSEYVHYQAGTS